MKYKQVCSAVWLSIDTDSTRESGAVLGCGVREIILTVYILIKRV
ncbi:hypothetical protein TERTU_3693 [Teredinibacter turnerae T7901]|uniref:Uncharacterized protein n=1 Tax=Teredinibacter turnerae (strain ATCC 39867 / T7901) TaxID=377629 RepID=C5BS77_TERTT|nr:hypothetical protein TERTU_3693 [Teredinibacter turnerae T7901]